MSIETALICSISNADFWQGSKHGSYIIYVIQCKVAINVLLKILTIFLESLPCGDWANKLLLGKNTWDCGCVPKNTRITFGFVLSEWSTSDTSYLPKLQEGNVFTGICLLVILSMGGLSCDHYPWCIGIWDLQPLPPLPLDTRHGTPLLTSGCNHWRPVPMCSLEDLPPTSTDI